MTFDLRFDTLSEFLSNFALVINQHASILNAMYEDSTKKATKKELSGCFKKTADAFAIVDEDFNKQVMLQLKAPRPTSVGESLEDKVKSMSNHMANKMDESKVAFSLLFNQNLELFDRVEKAEQRVRDLQESKADIFYTEQKVDKLRAELYTRADEVQKVEAFEAGLLRGDDEQLFEAEVGREYFLGAHIRVREEDARADRAVRRAGEPQSRQGLRGQRGIEREGIPAEVLLAKVGCSRASTATTRP